MTQINILHLFWIIPVSIIVFLILTHPNIVERHIAWHPIENKSIICYKMENKIKGINLNNCSNNKTYENQAIVKAISSKESWQRKFYCGKDNI